jgi:hypothetical protein
MDDTTEHADQLNLVFANAIPSSHMSNLADLARSIRDTIKSMVMYHLKFIGPYTLTGKDGSKIDFMASL